MFTVFTNETGNISSIRRMLDGSKTDVSDPSFRHLIDSIASMPVNVENLELPNHAVICFDERGLVEECKRRGIMLYASKGGFPLEKYANIGNAHLRSLQRTVEATQIGPGSGLTWGESNVWIPEGLVHVLDEKLADETSDIRRVSSLPIQRTFVYIDVSDFSKHPPGQQALIINSLVELVNGPRYWNAPVAGLYELNTKCEAMMCIGDGYIFVFKDPVDGVNFAAYLAYLVEVNVARRGMGRESLPVEFHFRMGAHCGKVFTFWDPGRNGWNYIGDGINGGNRVLSAMGKEHDDAVFISGQLKDELLKRKEHTSPQPDIVRALQNRGRHADKHGNPWRVYELNALQVFQRYM